MPNITKVVRFYRPILIKPDETRHELTADFWQKFRAHVATLSAKRRRVRYSGVTFRGDQGVGVAPALPYVRVGRVRTPVDYPDTVDSSDSVAPLTITGFNLLENAYIVPFGARNQVAVMNPIRGLVPLSAIETWMGSVLQLPAKGESIELVPEIDTKAISKLLNAQGVASLTVKIPHDEDLAMPQGSNSVVENALRQANAASRSELDVEITFTHGRRTPGGMAKTLQGVAERLFRTAGLERLDVSMILQDGDGFKREHHNLLRDQIASTAVFRRDDNAQMTVDEILEAINGAIKDFRSR